MAFTYGTDYNYYDTSFAQRSRPICDYNDSGTYPDDIAATTRALLLNQNLAMGDNPQLLFLGHGNEDFPFFTHDGTVWPEMCKVMDQVPLYVPEAVSELTFFAEGTNVELLLTNETTTTFVGVFLVDEHFTTQFTLVNNMVTPGANVFTAEARRVTDGVVGELRNFSIWTKQFNTESDFP